jgi:hypothetical protein
VKYLIMIYSNPQSLAVWAGMSDEERMTFGRDHLAVSERLAASGELIVSEGLADQDRATRVAVRDGQLLTTDGPFAEVKEHLAGFYLVECESLDRAVEWAAQVPDAATGYVEVRPVLDLRGLQG